MLRAPAHVVDHDGVWLNKAYVDRMRRQRCECCGGGLAGAILNSITNQCRLRCKTCLIEYEVSVTTGLRVRSLVGHDERPKFLVSIFENPEDDLPRLTFADWLDERADEHPSYPACAAHQRLKVALRQVLEFPEEDEPRLAYAGICEQYGMVERAEFIRSQLKLFRLPVGHDKSTLIAQGQKLMNKLFESLQVFPEASWTIVVLHMSLCPRSGEGVPTMILQRGFVHTIMLTGEQCCEYLDEVLENQPVRKVTLTSMVATASAGVSTVDGRFMSRVAGRVVPYTNRPEEVLHARWPRVPVNGWLDNPGYPDYVGQARTELFRSLGLPPQEVS